MERCVSPAYGNGSVVKVRASPDSAYSPLARMPKTRIGLRGRLESFRGSPVGRGPREATRLVGPETERKVGHGRDVASSGRRAAKRCILQPGSSRGIPQSFGLGFSSWRKRAGAVTSPASSNLARLGLANSVQLGQDLVFAPGRVQSVGNTRSRFKFKLVGAPESKSRGPLLIFKLG